MTEPKYTEKELLQRIKITLALSSLDNEEMLYKALKDVPINKLSVIYRLIGEIMGEIFYIDREDEQK